MNSNQFHHYFIPLFLVFYFLIAFLPVISEQEDEFFPFFSFNLYTKTPNGYTKYDILFNKGEINEYFLIHKNSNINKLERKNFMYRINILGHEFEESQKFIPNNYIDILSKCKTAFLVKISGDYIETIKKNEFDIEILEKLK